MAGGFHFRARQHGGGSRALQPSPEHPLRLIQSGPLQARKKLHGEIRCKGRDFSLDLAQDFSRGRSRQLVRLGEQHMHRFSGGGEPPEQHVIEASEGVPHIHDYRQSAQRSARLEILAQEIAPGRVCCVGNPGVAVAREIHEESFRPQRVEINQPGASRGLAYERDSASRKRVDGARFSRIRSTGKRDFADTRRQILRSRCALEKRRFMEERHAVERVNLLEYQPFGRQLVIVTKPCASLKGDGE